MGNPPPALHMCARAHYFSQMAIFSHARATRLQRKRQIIMKGVAIDLLRGWGAEVRKRAALPCFLHDKTLHYPDRVSTIWDISSDHMNINKGFLHCTIHSSFHHSTNSWEIYTYARYIKQSDLDQDLENRYVYYFIFLSTFDNFAIHCTVQQRSSFDQNIFNDAAFNTLK